MSATGFRRIGLADAVPRGSALYIPQVGVGGGGEFGAEITDELRTFAITREPAGHRIVFTVAHDIFDNWFDLELKDAEKKLSPDFDQRIQEELSRLKAKQELTRMAVFERAYGYAILVLNYNGTEDHEKPLTTDEAKKGLAEICAYGKPQITSIKKVTDQSSPRYGFPEVYFIERPGLAGRLKVHHTRVIHFATRLIKSEWEGKSVLDPLWDDLVTLRNIRWSMGQTMYRYGSGFFDLTFTGAEKQQIQDWITAGGIESISNRSYFAHNEKQSIELKGPSGRALDPMNYYLPILEHISMASGIPLAILRGAQAGALTGSEVNEREYGGLISDEQTAYEDGIRQLINIIASTTEANGVVPDYAFNWKSTFEMTEEKKADIELKKLQALQIKMQFMKRNEIRKEYDPELKELSDEEGGNEIAGRSTSKQPPSFIPESEGDSFLVTRVNTSRRSHRSR